MTVSPGIKSEYDARNFGRNWAAARGYNPDQMATFAAALFQKWGAEALSTQKFEDHFQGFVQAKTSIRSQRQTYGDQEWKLRDDWILETVKHLAIVNIAGLAGSTALYANLKNDPSTALKFSIGLFGLGLLLAVVDLFTNARAHYLNGLRANSLRDNAHMAESWDALVAVATAKYSSDEGDLCTQCAEVAGALSAFAAAIGVVLLIVHVI